MKKMILFLCFSFTTLAPYWVMGTENGEWNSKSEVLEVDCHDFAHAVFVWYSDMGYSNSEALAAMYSAYEHCAGAPMFPEEPQ